MIGTDGASGADDPLSTPATANSEVPSQRTDGAAADSGVGSLGEGTENNRFGNPGRPLARSPFLIGLAGGLGLAVAYLVYLGVQKIWDILLAVLVSMFLAIGLNPAVVKLRRAGLPRPVAVSIVALVTLLIVFGAFFAIVPPIITEGGDFLNQLPSYVDNLKDHRLINDLNQRWHFIDQLKAAATFSTVALAVGGVLSTAGILANAIFNTITVLVLTFYFLAAFERMRAGAYRLVPASRRSRVELIVDEILTKVGSYMGGSLVVAALAGISSWVFMLIADIPYGYALAVIVALIGLIPQIGVMVAGVVVTLVGFAVSLPVGIACVVFFVLYQQLQNWIIYPRIMSRSVQVTDLAVIVSLLIGWALLGVLGLLFAIPAYAAIQLIVREVVFPRQDRH